MTPSIAEQEAKISAVPALLPSFTTMTAANLAQDARFSTNSTSDSSGSYAGTKATGKLLLQDVLSSRDVIKAPILADIEGEGIRQNNLNPALASSESRLIID